MLARFEELMHMHKAALKWGLNYRVSVAQHILPYTLTISVFLSFSSLLSPLNSSINWFFWVYILPEIFYSTVPSLSFLLLLTSLLPLFFALRMTLFPTSWSSRCSVNVSFVALSVNRIASSSSNLPLNLHMGLSLVLTLSRIPRGLGKFDCAYP